MAVSPQFDEQMRIDREVARRRRDALSQLARSPCMAVAERIMEEDRDILRALAKGDGAPG